MVRLLVWALVAGSILIALDTPKAAAQKKKVDITKKWTGSVDDEKVAKPDVIASEKGFDAVWRTFKIDGDVPKVDFTKNLVVAVYSVGSRLDMAGANLDDKGNLDVLGFGTRDIRPGFRFVFGAVSRDGVKTVNGKALPKE